jgi:hypothetical protein
MTKCSCDEALHLRKALRRILKICTSVTGQTQVDDLAEIANLADDAVKLKPLPKPWTGPQSGDEKEGT